MINYIWLLLIAKRAKTIRTTCLCVPVHAYACPHWIHCLPCVRLDRLADVDVDDQLKTQQPCTSQTNRLISSRLVSPRLGAARRQLGSAAAEACSCSSPLAWAGRAAEPSARAANCRCQLSKWIFETNGIHHVPPGIHMPATWWIPLAHGPRRRGGGELRHSAHAQPAAREECVDAVCPADKWYDNCYKLWWHLAAWVCGKQRRGWAPDSASVLPSSSSSFLSVAVGCCCCCRCCCFCYCYYQAKLALATWWCCHMPLATCFLPPNHSPKKGKVRQAAAECCHLVVD